MITDFLFHFTKSTHLNVINFIYYYLPMKASQEIMEINI